MSRIIDEYKAVWNSDGTVRGTLIGGSRRCTLEGCRGLRLSVRWPDGKITYPCTKGLIERPDGEFQIG